jgi:GntR family transcriptional regulator of gluconate operon
MGGTMLKRENISDKLADAIGKKIIHNELKSGEIITETQISKEWDISRSPVRDALHILKNKWLLEKSSKGQYMVPVLDADYVENFFDAWIMFYQYTFSRAAKYITDKDSAHLLSVVEKIEKSIGYGDVDIYLQETAKFGRKILQIARNPIIERSASDLAFATQRLQFAAYEIEPSYPEKGLKRLWECYECLAGKDSNRAAKSMDRLVNVPKEILVNHFNGKRKK